MNSPTTDNQNRSLSERELEIVILIATGKSTRDIAANLLISGETVKTHRKNIHKKLKTHSVVQLIIKAKQLQIT